MNNTITLTVDAELSQALSAVCDLALKHAGLQAISAVGLVMQAVQKASAPSTTISE